MKANKEVQVIVIKEIEVAAKMVCKGLGPALFEAGTDDQSWWFIDELKARKTLQKIHDGKIHIKPGAYRKNMKLLQNFVTDSIEANAAYDLEHPNESNGHGNA